MYWFSTRNTVTVTRDMTRIVLKGSKAPKRLIKIYVSVLKLKKLAVLNNWQCLASFI